MRGFGLYAAVILFVCGLSATQAVERFGQWSLEQPEDFIFALSFKRSILFDDRTATSQLAFVCNQESKAVAVLLRPRDGTFASRHEAIAVAIQKIEEQSDQSDLMQRWENGHGYIFLGEDGGHYETDAHLSFLGCQVLKPETKPSPASLKVTNLAQARRAGAWNSNRMSDENEELKTEKSWAPGELK